MDHAAQPLGKRKGSAMLTRRKSFGTSALFLEAMYLISPTPTMVDITCTEEAD